MNMSRIWCERLVVEALPPFLGSAPGDLETLLGLNGWSRAKSILAAYSQERLWELKGGHLHSRYFLPSFLASAFLTYDLLPGRLENMYGRLPMRLSIALPFSLLTNRGASLPFLLCYGLSRLSSGQVAMSALETILEFGECVNLFRIFSILIFCAQLLGTLSRESLASILDPFWPSSRRLSCFLQFGAVTATTGRRCGMVRYCPANQRKASCDGTWPGWFQEVFRAITTLSPGSLTSSSKSLKRFRALKIVSTKCSGFVGVGFGLTCCFRLSTTRRKTYFHQGFCSPHFHL